MPYVPFFFPVSVARKSDRFVSPNEFVSGVAKLPGEVPGVHWDIRGQRCLSDYPNGWDPRAASFWAKLVVAVVGGL